MGHIMDLPVDRFWVGVLGPLIVDCSIADYFCIFLHGGIVCNVSYLQQEDRLHP